MNDATMNPMTDPALDAGWVLTVYAIYLVTSVALTVWVARTLHRNGRVFLIDTFLGNTELADSVNHLLVVGFYLVNAGFVALALRTAEPVATARAAVELLSVKLGLVLLGLGAMHFLNILLFGRYRRRALEGHGIRRMPPELPARA